MHYLGRTPGGLSVGGRACSDFMPHTCTRSNTRTPWRTLKTSPAARLQLPCCRTGLSRSPWTCRRRCCSPSLPCSILTMSAAPCSFAERVSPFAHTGDGCKANQLKAVACLHTERLAVPPGFKTSGSARAEYRTGPCNSEILNTWRPRSSCLQARQLLGCLRLEPTPSCSEMSPTRTRVPDPAWCTSCCTSTAQCGAASPVLDAGSACAAAAESHSRMLHGSGCAVSACLP